MSRLQKVKATVKQRPLPPDPEPQRMPETPKSFSTETPLPPVKGQLEFRSTYPTLDVSALDPAEYNAVVEQARTLTQDLESEPDQPRSLQLATGAPREILTHKLADTLAAIEQAKGVYGERPTASNGQALAIFIELAATLVNKIQHHTSPEDTVKNFDHRVLRPFCDGVIRSLAEEMGQVIVELRKAVDISKHSLISDVLNRAVLNYGQQTKILYSNAVSNSKDVVVKGGK